MSEKKRLELRKDFVKQLDRVIDASNKADEERSNLWKKIMKEENQVAKK